MFLGIEIGGTKLQLGIGAGDGRLVAHWRGRVAAEDGSQGIRRQIEFAIAEILYDPRLTKDDLIGVGVGFGGPVDDLTGRVMKSHQIAGWDDFPLVQWLSELVNLPVVLGNDCDCAGLAEALFGAGQGLSPIFYVTIGSGIGGGLIIDGEIYRGIGRGAAEIGHLRMPMEDGESATLENVASGWALQRLAGSEITVQEISRATRAGDTGANAVLQQAREHLADALCHAIALLCPRRIIIGGGVSLMGEELLFAPLRQLVAERVFGPFADCYEIVPAALGEEVVVHGALALARKHLETGVKSVAEAH